MKSQVGSMTVSGRVLAATVAVVVAMIGFWAAGAAPARVVAAPAGIQAAPAYAGAPVQDTLGRAIFHGKGVCFACHGAEGMGSPLAPSLKDTVWLHINGSVNSIAALVKRGVPTPKEFPQAMPPMGGAQLTDAEVMAVARYVHSLSAGAATDTTEAEVD